MTNHPKHRGSIHLEQASILEQIRFPDRQYVLRVLAPEIARRARPGSFAHISCGSGIPMRRPISIMRTTADGAVEFLYKPIGAGLEALASRNAGESLSVLGPIGNGFSLNPDRPRVLALGGGVGIPPMIFVAQLLHDDDRFDLTVLMGSEISFPIPLATAVHTTTGIDSTTMQSSALLNEWRVASHLASNANIPGTHRGYVTSLAEKILAPLETSERNRIQLVACGPEPMLRATAELAKRYQLPCELALEEFMACAVGGCAGCTVLTRGPDGDAMKRVCVDGPVFPAEQIYFETN